MVNISISQQELLARTQAKLGQALIENQVLDEKLAQCAAVMTPDQLQRVGFVMPEIHDEEPPAEAAPAESTSIAARKNGAASKEAVPS